MVVTRPERYRDALQAHYTASTPIVSFMASRLQPTNGDVIWEPCAGAGDLIDAVLAHAENANIRASEISFDAVRLLQEKYRNTSVDVRNEDALDVGAESLFEPGVSFTRIIANPPYGAYQSPNRRRQLQARFDNLYVRETYGVILFHSLSLLRHGGRLVFIVPDTFLWLTRHEVLRRKLVTQTTIEELALFPSKFFPNINFGYSGLCIITLTKAPPAVGHTIRIATDLPNAGALLDCIATRESSWPCSVMRIAQADLSVRPHAELVLQNQGAGILLSDRACESLGDHAAVKTGFYSGNDRRWIRKSNGAVPRSKSFLEVYPAEIAEEAASLHGFGGKRTYIPIIRGGAAAYVKPTQWYVDWSVEAVNEYKRKGTNPARFQNSGFYFRDGIAVPMVASGRITGAFMENRLFDQGIVGVFPHDPRLLMYFLGFFNSTIATDLVRQVNPTANNSANYIKRLPIVLPYPEELSIIDPLVYQAIDQVRQGGAIIDSLQRDIDSFYARLWNGTEGRIKGDTSDTSNFRETPCEPFQAVGPV